MRRQGEQCEAVDPDLWGRICADYHETGSADYVVRRDDGFAEPGEPTVYFRSEPAESEIRALEKARGHILDVGCGLGADVLWFQQRGMKVTGIDVSLGCVEVARKRGAKDVRTMSMWDIAELGIKFDTVLLMGNGMGLAGSVEKTGEFLDLLARTTNEGAFLIGHSIDPTATTEPRHLEYQKRNQAEGLYRGQLRIRKEYKGCVSPWWSLVLFERQVLLELCRDHGWVDEEIIGAGASYFLIARKAKEPSIR